jgi:uncharacterized protein (UPF0371 family)
MVTEWVPFEKGPEVVKLYPKIAQKPLKVLKRVGNSPYATTTEAGIKSVGIYEVEDAKLAEGIREAITRRSQYTAIPGYKLQIEVAYTVAEAMILIQAGTK